MYRCACINNYHESIFDEGARTRPCITMNSLWSLRRAQERETNIYDDVKNFQKQPHHSEPFVQAVEWLQECIEIHCSTGIPEVKSTLALECNGHYVIFEACVVQNSCVIKSIKYRSHV